MDRIGGRTPVKWYVREWRESRGLTQDAVASRLDTDKSVISQLENGKRRMNDGWIAGFSFAFAIEPSDLLRDPNAPTLEDLLKGATAKDREMIVDFIKRLTQAA